MMNGTLYTETNFFFPKVLLAMVLFDKRSARGFPGNHKDDSTVDTGNSREGAWTGLAYTDDQMAEYSGCHHRPVIQSLTEVDAKIRTWLSGQVPEVWLMSERRDSMSKDIETIMGGSEETTSHTGGSTCTVDQWLNSTMVQKWALWIGKTVV
ncbi:hypothetical protein STEG23_025724 [Scotinomys teguina]